MGGILGGKSTQTSSQVNTSNAGKFAEQLLGIGGDPAQGFQSYLKNAGFSSALGQGMDDIGASAAARGLIRSGATAKGYGDYTTGLRQQYFQNYINSILGTAGVENSSSGTQTGKKKPGLGSLIGSASSVAALSDRRAKMNIFKVGALKNGLGVYQYRYKDGTGPYVGVMADEVAEIMPEALGPVVEGYQTVNYGKINEVT